MAVTPLKVVQSETPPLLKEMNRLVDKAKIDRTKHQARIADVYRYTMPWRHQFNQSQHVPDIDVIFDELPGLVLEDFAADMLNTFTPQKNNWVEPKPVVTLDSGQSNQIKAQLDKYRDVVFDAMSRSNLYMALQEAYMDLGPGTMALLITDIDPIKPFHCEAIPAPELLITRGPYGYVDGVFRCRMRLRSEIKRLWPDANLELLGPEPREGDDPEYEVTDGCWRDWSDRGDESYKYACQANGKLIYHKQYKGEGSCPFIVARWGRDPTTAWGFGPTYRTLPAIKTRNHVRYLAMKNYDKHVDPAMSYEDDGVTNLDNGVTPGLWIPRAPDSDAPEPIESKARFDVQVFEMDELASIIRRAHYQDRPEQLGKTPPTATQWADEAAERARRMGTPATTLVHELQYPLFKRFAYLEAQRGTLPKVMLEGRDVNLQPESPLLRAQQQEEVIRLDRFVEMINVRFGPQVANVLINQIKYANRLALLIGVPPELLRTENEIAGALKQFAPIIENFAGGGGKPAAIAPPPVGAIS
jgi:hypothetical protein